MKTIQKKMLVQVLLGFLLGKLGKVDRKGADLLSMLLLLDVFFPCNVLAAASGDFGDMPFSQVLKIIAAYLSMFILFTYLAKPIAKLMGLNEDETLVFTRSVGYPNNGFVGIPLCTAVSARKERYWARFPCPAPRSTCSSSSCRAFGGIRSRIWASRSRA